MIDRQQYLTAKFQLWEFLQSSRFPLLAAQLEPSESIVDRLYNGCLYVLQPLRDHLGSTVSVTSGYRDRRLNTAVGGHPVSHHMALSDHCAADIVTPGHDIRKVARWLIDHCQTRYVIIYHRRNFLHISFPDSSGEYNTLKHKELF